MIIKTLTITGEEQSLPDSSANGTLIPIKTYRLSDITRESQKTYEIDVKDNDKLLEFVFNDDNNTRWMCDAATLHELFPEVEQAKRAADESFFVPATLQSPDGERGIFGKIAVKLLNVFAKNPVAKGIQKAAEKLEDNLMKDGEGLFHLANDFTLSPFGSKESNSPFLLFIHGTNSNTFNAFSKLKEADVWKFIQTSYGNNVLAYQHRTLTESPLQNALELIKQLPNNADLHIISHSRGGLIGDILCRYSTNGDNQSNGFTEDNIELLRKEVGRENDIDCIKSLNEITLSKKIKVKKFIRVACPAAGTRLASKRLDNILNVFFNLSGAEFNPIADIIKELLAETIKTKDNLKALPGLEAQNPDSPFIKILNDKSTNTAIDGKSLAIISGNGKWSVSFSGLKVILGKLFYEQRNDLVVNTDSMYLGANRKEKIQYFFDQGPDVDHHKYFLNHKTREAISFALQTADGEQIPGFTLVEQYQVPASDRNLRGFEYGELYPYPNMPSPSGKRPIVVLLPGIMGSNISRNGDKLWLAYFKSVFGGLTELQYINDKTVTATSLIKTSYRQLSDRLLYKYDVVIYPFDWRKQLNESAREFNDKILELLKYERPIKIIGHSMGGVLVRDFIINYDDTWQKLNKTKDFRLLFLGSPLGGSFRILTVLFGNDPIINSLNMLDRKHTKKELLSMFSAFPGILSLLPLTNNDRYDFANIDTWKKMADALGEITWPIPSQKELDEFKVYRDKILAKRDSIDYTNMVYIAGKDKYTPCDYYNDLIPPRTELVFLVTGEGDQSVTWESGIPQKIIDNNAVYYANVTHGALANAPEIFDAIEEILEKGTTNDLRNTKPVVRGEDRIFRMPVVYNFDLSERGLENVVFGITEKAEPPVSQIPISISVSNGDLAYASFPVLAGHFLNDGILYAEKAIDTYVNQSLSARHRLGLYPGEVGTNIVVFTDLKNSDFSGAIIVGLGDPGNLTSFQLLKTVEQGVINYLLQINNQTSDQISTKKDIGISAISIASGYGGLSLESSIKAIIEGVNNANASVTKVYKNETRTVQYIEFIEIYKDRALNCLYTLRKIESSENRMYNIKIGNKTMKKLFGWKDRLPVEMSDEWWNRLTVRCKKEKEGSEETSSLVFSASTGDAREEENELFSSTPLIDLFIEQISTKNQWDVSSAKTLFELMVPNAFKDRLKRKGNICWILDEDTADYPWELLQENITTAKPFCIGSGMIRQLSTNTYSPIIKRVATEMALIIADPQLDGFANQLKGARDEGQAVERMLTANGYPNVPLINKTSAEITINLFKNDYKIVHLAGHGIFKPKNKSINKSGMLIGNNVFLGTAQIAQLPSIPELVFVNCCHLGRESGDDERYFQNRYKLAANISTQLIKMGVKAVVAAGWAVDDTAAVKFAETFYSKMLEGYNFGDAVREARSDIYELYHTDNNTWGAYQCYGDPFYRLINRSTAKKDKIPSYVIEEEVTIDLNNLLNDLDTRNITPKEVLDKLNLISQAADKAEIKSCEIAEIEALIYYELGEYNLAIQKYAKLIQENQAKFSVAALEKYCNSRIKNYVQSYKSNHDSNASASGIDNVIGDLENILKINKTPERLSLLGSAYKRKGIVTTDTKGKQEAYAQAAAYYKDAYDTCNISYALNNWIVLQSALDFIALDNSTAEMFDPVTRQKLIDDIKRRKEQLKSSYTNMDYWEIIEDICYDLDLLMLDSQTAESEENWKRLEEKYRRLWKSAGSIGKRIAEIESFEVVSDLLRLSTSNHAIYLKQMVDELRSKLEKEITDTIM